MYGEILADSPKQKTLFEHWIVSHKSFFSKTPDIAASSFLRVYPFLALTGLTYSFEITVQSSDINALSVHVAFKSGWLKLGKT